jgi:uncharacterized protein DUF4412
MRFSIIGFLLLTAVASVAYADMTIVEQEEQTHPGGTNKSKVTLMIKGSMVRMDREFPPSSTIIDHSTGKSIGLFHYKKTYVESSASQEKEALEGIADSLKQSGRLPAERPKTHPTGKKDVINGWKVEKYVAETNSMKMIYWVARELTSVKEILNKATADPRMEVMNRQFPDPKEFPGLPVVTKLEMNEPMGKITTTTTIISVKESPIPDSNFSIPKDYKKQ